MKKNKKVPFFAQFLENQVIDDKTIKAGRPTDVCHDIMITLKAPSDEDEVTSPKLDIDVTLKYPSDREEVTSPKMDLY